MARYFELVDRSGKPIDRKENPVFKGSTPGQAAKKAATRGYKTIYLRERGQDKIREYKGSVKMVTLKADTAWASAGEKVKSPSAKFVGVVNK